MFNRDYFGYLDPADRMFAAVEMKFAIESKKLENAYNMVDSMYETALLRSEYTVLTESGTYGDLERMYREAADDAEDKKGGILQKLFGALKKLVDGIRNAIAKLFGGGGQKEIDDAMTPDVVVDYKGSAPKRVIGAITGAFGKLKGFVQKAPFINDDRSATMCIAACGTIAASIAGVGICKILKIRKKSEDATKAKDADGTVSGKEANDTQKEANVFLKMASDAFDKLIKTPVDTLAKARDTVKNNIGKGNSDKGNEATKTLYETLKGLVDKAGDVVTNFGKNLKGFASKVAGKIGKKKGNNSSDAGNGNDTGSSDEGSSDSGESKDASEDTTANESFMYDLY